MTEPIPNSLREPYVPMIRKKDLRTVSDVKRFFERFNRKGLAMLVHTGGDPYDSIAGLGVVCSAIDAGRLSFDVEARAQAKPVKQAEGVEVNLNGSDIIGGRGVSLHLPLSVVKADSSRGLIGGVVDKTGRGVGFYDGHFGASTAQARQAVHAFRNGTAEIGPEDSAGA